MGLDRITNALRELKRKRSLEDKDKWGHPGLVNAGRQLTDARVAQLEPVHPHPAQVPSRGRACLCLPMSRVTTGS